MAIKYYKYGDKTQLSPHFNVSEFQCKCGGAHETPIDENLVAMLEKLYAALDCSAIIISSGYRCVKHDKAVGGNGGGYHTKGQAADICCYAKNGAVISSKIVCCTAQDLGFGGIANINAAYTYTHVDVRTGGRWLGNEVVNYNTVTDDFYKYYGIKRPEEPEKPVLKKGDKGESVRQMQARLAAKGYLRKSEIDGDFGRITLCGICGFQFEAGLTVTGVYDKATQNKL